MIERQPDSSPVGREVLWASVGIIGAMAALKHGIQLVPPAASLLATLAVALQLFVPLFRAGSGGVTHRTLGLRLDRWTRDLGALAVAIVGVTPPYVLGFFWWVPWAETFRFQLPPDFVQVFFFETLIIAFAEEVFFRGYLQERWTRWDPRGWRFLGVAWRPIVMVSGVFAAVHFVGEYNPARLGPFFPSLLFGLLRVKTGTVVSASVFHAYCNALAEVLFYGFS